MSASYPVRTELEVGVSATLDARTLLYNAELYTSYYQRRKIALAHIEKYLYPNHHSNQTT